jgi:hypothetical protein
MKMQAKQCGIALCMAGLLAASAAQATATIALTFDENGNWSVAPPGSPSGITYSTTDLDNKPGTVGLGTLSGKSEPSGGGAATLDYLYAPGGSTWLEYGWLVVYAPGATLGGTANIVDLIHFDNSVGNDGGVSDQMFFYSLEGTGNLANNWVSSGTLSAILAAANTVSINENLDGSILYNPASYFVNGESAPGYNMNDTSGFAPAGTQYTYNFQSIVPEPSAMLAGAIMLLPFGASTLRFLRKNRAA